MKSPQKIKAVFVNLKKKVRFSLPKEKLKELYFILSWIGINRHLRGVNLADLLKEHIQDFRLPGLKKEANLTEPFIYCALGDSTVEGIGATSSDKSYPALIFASLKQLYPEAFYHNFGQIGAISKDIIENQLSDAIKQQPKLVTISIGANDVMRGVSKKEFKSNLDLILKRLTVETQATVVINNIPDFSNTSFVPKPLRYYCQVRSKMINKIIQQKAVEYNIVFIDLHSQSKVFKDYPGLVSSDGLHPSDLGYALWATTIISQVYQLFFLKKKLVLG